MFHVSTAALRRVLYTMLACLLLASCAGASGAQRPAANTQEQQLQMPVEGETIAVIATDYGDISLRLFAEYAPLAVQNFIGLAQQGVFNGLAVHRIVPNFVIQTGDPTGTGTGGTTIWNGTAYPVERSDKLHHYSGAVGLAHTEGDTNGNQSQFYIVQTPSDNVSRSDANTLKEQGMRDAVADAYQAIGGAPHLDNNYTVFGQVFSGMEAVDAIAAVELDENGNAAEPVIIRSVTITQYTAPTEPESTASSVSAASVSTAPEPAA